jgi:hypothetical protein
MPGKKPAPKKTAKTPRREGALLLLMNPEERAQIEDAARRAGLGTGSWIRMVALERARAKT